MKRRRLNAPARVRLRLTLGETDRTGQRGRWLTRTPDGPATVILQSDATEIEASAWGTGADWALDQLPHLLGFDDRPEEFSPAHKLLRDLHRRHRGFRIGRTNRVFEAIVPAVLGQKVTTKEAHQSLRRLTSRFSDPAPGPVDGNLPISAGVLAELAYWQLHELGIERKRTDVLRFVARRATRLEEITGMAHAAAFERLTAFPGVGPWTAANVMGEALGDADAVPIGDYHIPNMVAWALAGEPRSDDQRMLELLEPYRGHRGRVIRLLKASGIHAPRYGPKTAIRSITHI